MASSEDEAWFLAALRAQEEPPSHKAQGGAKLLISPRLTVRHAFHVSKVRRPGVVLPRLKESPRPTHDSRRAPLAWYGRNHWATGPRQLAGAGALGARQLRA